jgi:hypothetical protein
MEPMSYFRRPELMGTAGTRLPFAVVRGSVRRLDADHISAVPYFPGAGGTTLSVATDGGTYTIPLTGDSINAVIADINMALGAGGRAYDEDGCIAIQTTTPGAAGWVEVRVSAAAPILGFHTLTGPVRSQGGDFPSTPHGRRGNWQGVAFPIPGEEPSAAVLSRPLARLASNLDVLHADLTRPLPVVEPLVQSWTINWDGQTQLLTLDPGEIVCVGYGVDVFPDARAAQDALLSSFRIVDAETGTPLASQVRDIRRGGTSVLGASPGSLQKMPAPVQITEILEGRIVRCAGAHFYAWGVAPGDFGEISDVENVVPFSHGGKRWRVARVVGDEYVELAPLSKAEILGWTSTQQDAQPVLELNPVRDAGASYGSLLIYTGAFTNNVSLAIDPPIPESMYDRIAVWVPRPKSLREIGAWDLSVASYMPPRVEKTLPNALLGGFELTVSAQELVVGFGWARVDGQLVRVPEMIVPLGELQSMDPVPTVNEPAAVVFDEQAGYLVLRPASEFLGYESPHLLGNHRRPFDQGALGVHPVVTVYLTDSGNELRVESALRLEAPSRCEITVGEQGQCKTLAMAVGFINAMARSGSNGPFEIVLLDNASAQMDESQAIQIDFPYIVAPNVVIRGVLQSCTLNLMDSLSLGNATGKLTLRNLTLTGEGVAIATSHVSAAWEVELDGVVTDSNSFRYIVSNDHPVKGIVGKFTKISIVDSDITAYRAIARVRAETTPLHVQRSKLRCFRTGVEYSAFQAMQVTGASVPWRGGDRISIQDSAFLNWGNATTSAAILDVSPSDDTFLCVEGNVFSCDGSTWQGPCRWVIYAPSSKGFCSKNYIPNYVRGWFYGDSLEIEGNIGKLTLGSEDAVRGRLIAQNQIETQGSATQGTPRALFAPTVSENRIVGNVRFPDTGTVRGNNVTGNAVGGADLFAYNTVSQLYTSSNPGRYVGNKLLGGVDLTDADVFAANYVQGSVTLLRCKEASGSLLDCNGQTVSITDSSVSGCRILNAAGTCVLSNSELSSVVYNQTSGTLTVRNGSRVAGGRYDAPTLTISGDSDLYRDVQISGARFDKDVGITGRVNCTGSQFDGRVTVGAGVSGGVGKNEILVGNSFNGRLILCPGYEVPVVVGNIIRDDRDIPAAFNDGALVMEGSAIVKANFIYAAQTGIRTQGADRSSVRSTISGNHIIFRRSEIVPMTVSLSFSSTPVGQWGAYGQVEYMLMAYFGVGDETSYVPASNVAITNIGDTSRSVQVRMVNGTTFSATVQVVRKYSGDADYFPVIGPVVVGAGETIDVYDVGQPPVSSPVDVTVPMDVAVPGILVSGSHNWVVGNFIEADESAQLRARCIVVEDPSSVGNVIGLNHLRGPNIDEDSITDLGTGTKYLPALSSEATTDFGGVLDSF